MLVEFAWIAATRSAALASGAHAADYVAFGDWASRLCDEATAGALEFDSRTLAAWARHSHSRMLAAAGNYSEALDVSSRSVREMRALQVVQLDMLGSARLIEAEMHRAALLDNLDEHGQALTSENTALSYFERLPDDLKLPAGRCLIDALLRRADAHLAGRRRASALAVMDHALALHGELYGETAHWGDVVTPRTYGELRARLSEDREVVDRYALRPPIGPFLTGIGLKTTLKSLGKLADGLASPGVGSVFWGTLLESYRRAYSAKRSEWRMTELCDFLQHRAVTLRARGERVAADHLDAETERAQTSAPDKWVGDVSIDSFLAEPRFPLTSKQAWQPRTRVYFVESRIYNVRLYRDDVEIELEVEAFYDIDEVQVTSARLNDMDVWPELTAAEREEVLRHIEAANYS